ncbi:hypothetical protein KA107_02770 [Candidatus Pacearchaeota archaeon]|nr:hypothetical protein [Candidatus Pacearchaeota archaeon]
MTRKIYPLNIVHEEQLERKGLKFERIDPKVSPLVDIRAGTIHAIVRNLEGTDIGYVVYASRNGLPYSEFDRNVRYMFWKEDKITRTSRPEASD